MTAKKLGKFLSKFPEDFHLWIGVPGAGPGGQLLAIPAIDIRIKKDRKAAVLIMSPPRIAQKPPKPDLWTPEKQLVKPKLQIVPR